MKKSACPEGYQKIVKVSDCKAAVAFYANDMFTYNPTVGAQVPGGLCYKNKYGEVEIGSTGPGVDWNWICKPQEIGKYFIKLSLVCLLSKFLLFFNILFHFLYLNQRCFET